MSDRRRGHVLIAGITTRPFAMSAAQAGYRVTAIDAFGDRDLRFVADVILARSRAGQRYGPAQAATAGALVAADWVAYTSNFENYPRAVARLSQGRRLLGNPPDVLRRSRDPLELGRVLQHHGLPFAETRHRAPEDGTYTWLLKPRRSGGGHGISIWTPGRPIPRGMYLQRRIAGLPGSISFAANGSTAVVLGFSRQMVGEAQLGAQRYRYCGSLLGTSETPQFPRQEELFQRASELARLLAGEFRLVGLNGIDFIARNGVPYPTEVNPRYSASMELIERGAGLSMFQTHFQACSGVLPAAVEPAGAVQGKAIVFARRAGVVAGMRQWTNPWIADIPSAGERIMPGRPICTVFAHARSAAACRRLLLRRAAIVYRMMTPAQRRAA
jgi:uncharacterized protein